MDIIKELLLTFSEKQYQELQKFMVRQKPSVARKDSLLLDDIWKSRNVNTINTHAKGRATYHANRKRIRRSITDFVVLQRMEEDPSQSGTLQGLFATAHHLFSYGRNEAAWRFLLKAEQSAIAEQRNGVLIQIYRLMAEHLHEQQDYSFAKLANRLEKVRIIQEQLDLMQLAKAKIRMELLEIRRTGKNKNFERFVNQTFAQYNLDKIERKDPTFLLDIIEISRSTYLAIRDLRNFEGFIKQYYSDLETSMQKLPANYIKNLVRLEYMMAHVLFRNRKFAESEIHLNKLNTHMNQSAAVAKAFTGKYISLKGSLLSLTGRNQLAITEHEEVLRLHHKSLSTNDRLNMELNLAFFYFNTQEFGKANKVLLYMTHSDGWYAKKMGAEWVLRKELIRAIVQYELGNEDQAIKILSAIRKNYTFLLNKPIYKKAAMFLPVLENFMKDPYAISFKQFNENAEKNMFIIPAEEEESKSLAFYGWMKAKLLNKNYYEVMMEEVN
ncbi:MAG: hypothetical protein ACK4K0_11410 [Flavobacteriales bacterium]